MRYPPASLVALLCLLTACTAPERYDVIIRNGTVYDGSGGEGQVTDVGIRGDSIAAIGDLSSATATTELDAAGKAVAPGFINMLSWANVSLLHDGRSLSDIKQGVTLEVLGEGRSMGPLSDSMRLDMLEEQDDIKYEIPWTTLGEYLTHLEDKGVATNVTSFVGNGTLRQHVIGFENRPATAAELERMKVLLATAMEEGAVGLSSSLLYAPSQYADTEELIELSKVAARYGGMYISHIRDEGEKLIPSVAELIRISREAGLPAEVYHLKASGEANWNKLDSVFAMIEAARAEGLAITADMYTYPASSTGLHIQLPGWVREGGVDAALERLGDPETRARALADTEFERPPNTILLVGFRNPDLRKYQGMYLSDLAEQLGKSPAETMIDLMVEDQSRIQVVYFSMSEDNIRKKIVQPWMSFCSDAGSLAAEGVFLNRSTHPRAYGSFARVLGRYARDEGLLTVGEGVRRLSALAADNLGIARRGRLQPGYFADVVIFDPTTITDVATYEKPHQYAEGVEQVLVNGTLVLRDGEPTGAMPGRFVRRARTAVAASAE